jgi:sugar phosphate permease
MKKQTFYPWLIVLISLLAITINNGLSTSITSIFDKFLKADFNITDKNLSVLKWRDTITNIGSAVFVFISGYFIDRFGAKKVMIFGSMVLALAYFLYSKTSSMTEIYGVHILLAIALVTSGSIPNIILISTWFKKRRGLALGIALIGTSLGGFIAAKSPLVEYIKSDGWRNAMLILAIFPLIFLVLVLLFVRKSPQEVGLKPFGSEETNEEENFIKTGLSYSEALKTPVFWLIGVCGFLTFYSVVAIVSNSILYATESGFSIEKAVELFGYYFLFSVTGKFIFSFLSDYINPFRIFTLCSLIMLVGSFGFSFMKIEMLWYMLPITALGWGGIYTLYNVMIVRSFGLKSAGKINGTISVLESIGSAIAPVLTAYLHDKYDYQTGFMVVSLFLLISVIISFGFWRFEKVVLLK